MRVVEHRCADVGADLVCATDGVQVTAAVRDGAPSLDLHTPARHYADLTLALRGPHQVQNAVAVRLLETLANRGTFRIPKRPCEPRVEHVAWPGRLELRPSSTTNRC